MLSLGFPHYLRDGEHAGGILVLGDPKNLTGELNLNNCVLRIHLCPVKGPTNQATSLHSKYLLSCSGLEGKHGKKCAYKPLGIGIC